MSEPNATIIRKAYADFAQGNVPAVFAAFDANITWHVPGHSPLSGDYRGHAQIGNFFQRIMELSGGAFGIDVHNVLADDDLVVVLTTVNAQRNGVSTSFSEIHVWRMKDGKAIEFCEYQGERMVCNHVWRRYRVRSGYGTPREFKSRRESARGRVRDLRQYICSENLLHQEVRTNAAVSSAGPNSEADARADAHKSGGHDMA
jgi:uncharacterized protein